MKLIYTQEKDLGDKLMDFLSKKTQCLRKTDPDLTSASWFPYSGADSSTDQINLPSNSRLWEAICHEKKETISPDVFLLWNWIFGWVKVLVKDEGSF